MFINYIGKIETLHHSKLVNPLSPRVPSQRPCCLNSGPPDWFRWKFLARGSYSGGLDEAGDQCLARTARHEMSVHGCLLSFQHTYAHCFYKVPLASMYNIPLCVFLQLGRKTLLHGKYPECLQNNLLSVNFSFHRPWSILGQLYGTLCLWNSRSSASIEEKPLSAGRKRNVKDWRSHMKSEGNQECRT